MGGMPSKTVALKATLTSLARRSSSQARPDHHRGLNRAWLCGLVWLPAIRVGGCGSRAWLISESRGLGSRWASLGPHGSRHSPWN